MTHKITLIPGDGTGPEIMNTVRKVVDATKRVTRKRALKSYNKFTKM